MNLIDERLKGAFGVLLMGAGVDTKRLSIEVNEGVVTITGMVSTLEQRHMLWSLLETADTKAQDIDFRVGVLAPKLTDAGSLDLTGDNVPSTLGNPSRHT